MIFSVGRDPPSITEGNFPSGRGAFVFPKSTLRIASLYYESLRSKRGASNFFARFSIASRQPSPMHCTVPVFRWRHQSNWAGNRFPFSILLATFPILNPLHGSSRTIIFFVSFNFSRFLPGSPLFLDCSRTDSEYDLPRKVDSDPEPPSKPPLYLSSRYNIAFLSPNPQVALPPLSYPSIRKRFFFVIRPSLFLIPRIK